METVYATLDGKARAWWGHGGDRKKERASIRRDAATWRKIRSAGYVTVAHSGAYSASWCGKCATNGKETSGHCSWTGCGPEIVTIARRLGIPVLRFDRLTFEQAYALAVRGPMIGCACDMKREGVPASCHAIFGAMGSLDYVPLQNRIDAMRAINPDSVEMAPS